MSATEKIQQVAAELKTMAHVAPPQGSLAANLHRYAHLLNEALEELGQPSADSPVDGAIRALEHVGICGVDRLLVGLVLEERPALVGKAAEWGWTDTEVRDQVAEYIVRAVLRLSQREYWRRVDADQSTLVAEFWAEHARQPWMQSGWEALP